MKKTYLFIATFVLFLGCSILMASTDNKEPQAPVEIRKITVNEETHDFGTISEKGGNVSTTFVLTNNTDQPVVISNVRASCGCTTPTWTKEPIAPGKTGTVTATYNPMGRPGSFSKSITITTSGEAGTISVFIKGVVEQ